MIELPPEDQRLFTWEPNPGPQTQFLASSAYEVLYGGSAGGGKSESLIVAPLRWVQEPSFRGIILRRTFPELEKSIIDRSRQLYPAVVPGASYNAQEKLWRFPSGARMYFGHAEHEQSVYQYQGAEFSYLGFDELTHFTEKQYTYMLSRARSSAGLPVRIRSTSNPGGPGQEWVMKRWAPWLDPESKQRSEPGVTLWYENTEEGERYASKAPGLLSRAFIPAPLDTNPHLVKNDPGYRQRLMGLDRVTRAQLLDGNWLIRPAAGAYFQRGWFRFIDVSPVDVGARVRAWDLASVEGGGDWTVGVLMARTKEGGYVVEDVVRGRWRPKTVEATVLATAATDGRMVRIQLPQDPGQAGKAQVESYTRLLAGYNVRSRPITGDKVTRAQPFSAQCEAGNVAIVKARWNEPFMQCLEAFPEEGVHDDDVDAAADAFNAMCGEPAASYGSATFNGPSFTFGNEPVNNWDDD